MCHSISIVKAYRFSLKQPLCIDYADNRRTSRKEFKESTWGEVLLIFFYNYFFLVIYWYSAIFLACWPYLYVSCNEPLIEQHSLSNQPLIKNILFLFSLMAGLLIIINILPYGLMTCPCNILFLHISILRPSFFLLSSSPSNCSSCSHKFFSFQTYSSMGNTNHN